MKIIELGIYLNKALKKKLLILNLKIFSIIRLSDKI